MYSQPQLEAALERLVNAENEAEQDGLCAEISRFVADPGWMDLIFQSDDFVRADGSLDVPALARRILGYGPAPL